MKIQTNPGHKYTLNRERFMVVSPDKNLRKSHLIEDVHTSTDRTLTVNLKRGILTIHKYPELYLTYGPKIRANPVKIVPRSYNMNISTANIEEAILDIAEYYRAYGAGRVIVQPNSEYSFSYKGDLAKAVAELSFIFMKAQIGDVNDV